MALHLNQKALDKIVAQRSGKAKLAAAEQIAAKVNAMGILVGGEDGYEGEYLLPVKPALRDDGEVRVALAHPSGKAVQAKHGALTKGAAAAGFEVHG